MTTINPLDDAPLSRFHKKLALFSSGGPFLDGYVLSIIGVAMVQFADQWSLSSVEQGLVGASSLIGILLGAYAGGWLTDKFGREILFTIDLVAIIVFSVAQFFVQDVVWLIILRLLIGMAVGADYPIATSLLTEFTPRKYRGPFLGAFVAMWFVGAAAAYVVGEFLARTGHEDAWRWMLASAAVPATLIVLARVGTPESPRWLANKGKIDEANEVMRKVYGPTVSIADLPREDGTVSVKDLLRSGYGKRMAFITLFWTCSIVPLFAVYAFAPAILGALKLEGDAAHFGSAVITILFLVGCVVALLLVNRMGRRPLLIHSFLWSGLALLILGLFPEAPSVIIMALFAIYAVVIGGSQILQWVYPNELFPTEIRGSAVGMASSLSRIGAAVGTFLVPLSLSGIGIGPTMLIAAAITLLGAVLSQVMAPETRGMALTESAALSTTTRTTLPTA
ncbi:MFS transporter [Rhodococcus sp. ACS1]|uniref:MFS transporter, putative metabolite transport protein n=1 Tax=Rhodococcus koreensis TaxID=99653 RepID=A0A1H4XFZ4_9NOCA|nr:MULTISPECIES: MFS transporter [Rhodococcus]PBC48190.1 MFS transporter [Rhodococcus sp. ACS1]QSE80322.1 MFS transporter [Rhodococcus koreensis]SED04050.1 MFS transporter, putative metabolite transport protein [Rhodococcus koreensis]